MGTFLDVHLPLLNKCNGGLASFQSHINPFFAQATNLIPSVADFFSPFIYISTKFTNEFPIFFHPAVCTISSL